MNTIHTPERYVTEIKEIDGKKQAYAIMYFGRTHKLATMRQMIQDRKKVFGDKWKQCEARIEKGVLVVSLRKRRGRLHKSELR